MVSFSETFITTLSIMLFAEIADKTNLLALSLMTESKKPKTVALGGLVGIAVVTFIGIVFSSFIQNYIPESLVKYISGIVFIILGILGLIENGNEDEELKTEEFEEKESFNVFAKSISLIGIAEFGDKSQIFVISSSLVASKLAVFLGAMAGMAIIMILTVIFGRQMLEFLPENKIHMIASCLFVIVGIWIIFF